MPSLRILIVGGGIAGLALGRALREQGVVPEIIERAASWPTRGRTIVKIEYLADHAGAIPTLAQWHHDQWHTITPHLTVADRIAGFRSRMRRLDVPTGFVAVLDEVVVGMACLVAHDMETRPELTPWLATVLVAPDTVAGNWVSAIGARRCGRARARVSEVVSCDIRQDEFLRTAWLEHARADGISRASRDDNDPRAERLTESGLTETGDSGGTSIAPRRRFQPGCQAQRPR